MLKCRFLRAFSICAVIWSALAATNAGAQTISFATPGNVGSGLQGNAVGVSLSTGQHGGKTVHVESDDPSVVLVSPNSSTAGTASFDVFVPNGTSATQFVVQGVENVTGSANITVSAPGFTGASHPATIVQPAVDIVTLGASIDALAPSDLFFARVGLPSIGNGSVNPVQNVRIGGAGLTATIVNSNAVTGQLVTTPTTGQTVTVSIAPGNSLSPASVAAGGVAFDPLAVGATTVSATIPGFITTTAATQNITVTQPVVVLNAIPNVGAGLQGNPNGITLSGSEHGGVTVHVESTFPSIALVSPNASTAGAASFDVFLANGFNATSFVVSGVEGPEGGSLITVSAPGFTSASRVASIEQAAIDLTGLGTTIDTLDPADLFQVRIGLSSGGTSVNPSQNIRTGGVPVAVTIKNSAAVVGDLVTTPLTGDSVVVTIPVGAAFTAASVAAGGVAFDGAAIGSTTVSATSPGIIATTQATRSVSVTQPIISMNNIGDTGSGLVGLGNNATLSAAQHGGVTVHVESASPAVALVAPNSTTPGTASFDVFVANGSSTVTFYVSGVEDTTGTSLIAISAPGFIPASKTATIVQPAVDIVSLVTTIDTLSPADVFQVRVGLPGIGNASVNPAQNVRAGGPALTATIKNLNQPVGDLITTPLTGDSVVVSISPGSSSSPASVVSGGVAFDGTALGSTTVSAAIPGFITTTAASQTVTVTQPSLAFSPPGSIGSGLQSQLVPVTLSVSNHGGVTVHVESSNPAVALVAPNVTTMASASIDVFVPNNTGSTFFVIAGVENATGSVNVTATAPGFIGVTRPAIIATPALDMSGLAAAMDTTDPNDPFQIRVGLPAASNASVSPMQVVRFGAPALTATVVLTNATAAQLVTTLASNDTVTVSIPAGASSSAATVAAGGVAFDPLAPGTTLVAATIPGFTPTGAATQQVVVSQRIVTLAAIENVGAGLQSGVITAVLGLAQHGGVTVHVASSDSSVALLAPNFSTPGTESLDFPLSNGSTQVSFFVHGMAIGTSTITASVPTFTPGVRAANIVQPAFQVALLADSLMDNDANDPFVVRVGTPTANQAAVGTAQFVRAGGPTLTATVSLTDLSYASLVTDTENGSPVTVTIPAGESQSATSAVLGGVEFDPLYPGTTTASATIAGFLATTAASHVVVVKPHLQPTGAGNLPRVFALEQNIPNPFNPITHIRFALPAPTPVTLSVFDVRGHLVTTLVDGVVAAGETDVIWNGHDARGASVSSGIYFYRLSSAKQTLTRKMILLK